ncbi:MAG: tetratricopeptide repeat protein [Spirochaetales bacterium]|nr:tetratricopeptide repeat protein [Spirochaetales bacterium]
MRILAVYERVVLSLILLFFSVFSVFSQEIVSPAPEDPRLNPIFPAESAGLVFIEGEDAVSTNFSGSAVYNYGCSELQTLQLSRSTGLQGGTPFFAQYVFYIEEAGTYSFGYGGTPPGPSDDLYPSYVSPFSYTIDDGPNQNIYREDVIVTGVYSPSYYWMNIGELELTAGVHTITFRVSEKREYDNTYFFYLDNFFLLNNEYKDEIYLNNNRALFPPQDADPVMDEQFLTIADYNKKIQLKPEDPEPYIELSLIHSLLGDYLSALKMLNKASALDPENSYPLLLSAKNKIWKGDIADGIAIYRRVLALEPDNLSLWAEAAKVAAWTNLYSDAIAIYTEAMKNFPDDISLMVNLALTYLWMSNNADADKYLRKARETAESDPSLFSELGRVFIKSGYTEKAVEVYSDAVKRFPEYLGLYLRLESAYERLGDEENADEVYQVIEDTFKPSRELSAFIDLFRKKSGLKESVISQYQDEIKADPANLELRTFLVQTYFWNGLRRRAVDESLNILAAHAYNNFLQLDSRSSELYSMIETMQLFNSWLSEIGGEAGRRRIALQERLSAYSRGSQAAIKESGTEGAGTTAQDLFREEEERMYTYLSETANFIETWRNNLETIDSTIDIDEIVKKENDERMAFEQINKSLNWKWDRNFAVDELEFIRQKDPLLSGYVLSRIYHFEEEYGFAREILDTLNQDDEGLPAIRFAEYQSASWEPLFGGTDTGDTGVEADPVDSELLLEYAPYLYEVESISALLLESVETAFLYPEDVSEEAERLLGILSEIRSESIQQTKNIQSKLRTLRKVALNRMRRSFYQLEEKTYLLRYELGDYYLALDLPELAVEQYEKVLSIDPWNISATYKLGTVQQLSGNWSSAMASYTKVFWSDPDYANTVTYHNQLAREHADSFSFNTTSFYDNSRINNESRIEYNRPINSLMGWKLGYIYNNDRIYRTDPGYYPPSFNLHSFVLDLPLSLYFWNFTLTPRGGVTIYNELSNKISSFDEDDSLEPDIVTSQFRQDLFYGVTGKIQIEQVELSGGWEYKRKRDTYLTGRDAVFYNSGEVTVSSYFPFPEKKLINALSTRTYGRIEFLDDNNMVGSIAQEVLLSLHLQDTPWTNLDIISSGSYENSKTSGVSDYYAPDNAASIKGGLRGSIVLPAGSGGTIGTSLWLSAGATGSDLDSGGGFGLQTEGILEVGYYRGYSALSFSFYGNGAFTDGEFPETDYWSFQGSLGFSTRMPTLLTP